MAILTASPGGSFAASTHPAVPSAAIGAVRTIGITDGALPVYVATSSGLYRSAAPDLSRWSKQNANADIISISPNPASPGSLVFAADGVLYRSTDGGHIAARVVSCFSGYVARSYTAPAIVYAASHVSPCTKIAALYASTDDGRTWTTVYTDTTSLDTVDGDATNPAHLLIPQTFVDNAGAPVAGNLWQSFDGGRTRTDALPAPASSAILVGNVTAALINPRRSSELWAIRLWATIYHSRDGGRSWDELAAPPPSDLGGLVSDPLTGRLYLPSRPEDIYAVAPVHTTVYALDPNGAFEPSLIGADDPVTNAIAGVAMGITRTGYVLVAGVPGPLTVRPLISSRAWRIAPVLSSAYVRRHGTMLLGGALSPLTRCGQALCQYFDKGALAAGQSSYTILPLVPRLLAARLSVPVGGSSSTVTYKTLNALHSQRTPPPTGLAGGTVAVHGGTFVPYSPTLAPVSGYIVPAYFWRYLSSSYASPDGWQQDVGLPLTPAVAATVRKGTLGTRHIMLQAFQNAVLTYDPQNPAPFQVERANIGADFAAAFPQAVR